MLVEIRQQTSNTESEANFFHPEINEISRRISAAKKQQEGDDGRVEDRLQKYAMEREIKKNQIKIINEQLEKSECSFTPKLDAV